MNGSVAILKVGLAAGLDHGDVGVHDVVFGSGELDDARRCPRSGRSGRG